MFSASNSRNNMQTQATSRGAHSCSHALKHRVPSGSATTVASPGQVMQIGTVAPLGRVHIYVAMPWNKGKTLTGSHMKTILLQTAAHSCISLSSKRGWSNKNDAVKASPSFMSFALLFYFFCLCMLKGWKLAHHYILRIYMLMTHVFLLHLVYILSACACSWVCPLHLD